MEVPCDARAVAIFRALTVPLAALALSVPAVVADQATAATPGTYLGVGSDRPCVSIKVAKSGKTLSQLILGGCEWRFVCGSNGSRGAPALSAGRVALSNGRRFEVHRTSAGFAGSPPQLWDAAGSVRGERASGTFRFHYGSVCDTGVIHWEAALKRKLEANAGGPYVVGRGEELMLNGSGSTPRRSITSYRWTFSDAYCPQVELGNGAAATESVTPHVDAQKYGRAPSVKALCSITATLTVSDGTSTDTDSARIRVAKRSWKRIRFAHAARPEPFEANLFGSTTCLDCVFGKNVCSHERADHWIHPGPPASAIARGGVKLAQVHDPNGPFDGMAYVRSRRLEISRVALINRRLYPGSELYRINARAGRASDVDALRQSVADHERFHSELGQKALPANDPTSALEALVSENTGALSAYVAARLSATEQALQAASSDSAVHRLMRPKWGRRSAKIKLPPDYDGYYFIRSLAELGDERR